MFMRPAYQCLPDLGFIHKTVNPPRKLCEPKYRCSYTKHQKSMVVCKKKKYIMKKKKGVSLSMLQSYLDRYYWEMWRQTESDLIIALLSDIKTVYVNNGK